MCNQLILFEDNKYTQLKPLSSTRAVHSLKCGIYTLSEKMEKWLPDLDIYLHQRDLLAAVTETEGHRSLFDKQHLTGDFLIVNGRILANQQLVDLIKQLQEKKTACIYTDDDDNVLAGYLTSLEDFEVLIKGDDVLKVTTLNCQTLNMISYPWDLIHHNPAEITNDLPFKIKDMDLIDNFEPFRVIIQDVKNVYIDRSVTLKPGVIIDGEDGPVIIDKNACVMHNSVIIGPAYIGECSVIKIGAKIYEGTSIGKVCKVGGEVEESIFHSYSNKQHDGFLGHAYVGSWCNFGADTNNSDLKNNYENVKVEIDGQLIDSGCQFAGLYMGDHAKTGINTMLNTGTVIGVACNVYGEGFPPRNVPDFHWGGAAKLVRYPFKRTMKTVKVVESRRYIDLSEAEFEVMKDLFETVKKQIR